MMLSSPSPSRGLASGPWPSLYANAIIGGSGGGYCAAGARGCGETYLDGDRERSGRGRVEGDPFGYVGNSTFFDVRTDDSSRHFFLRFGIELNLEMI